MDSLSKDQLILLQHHLTYETYEKFMSLFDKDEEMPVEENLRQEKIIEIMKEHDYWGEIKGWGDNSVYSKIPENYQFFLFSGVELMLCDTKYKVKKKLDMLERQQYPYEAWLQDKNLSV